jgi:protein MAK11
MQASLYLEGTTQAIIVSSFFASLLRRLHQMAKRDTKPAERVIKKAKIDTTSKVPKHRVKDSSRPYKLTSNNQSLPEPTSIKGKGKAKENDTSAASKPELKKNHAREEEEYPLPSTFKVIAGSYEKLLYGLDGSVTTSEDNESKLEFHLKPIFIFPAHVSCIKAVAASPQGGKWLASGSADEIVKVWDLRRRKEIGGLMHHEGLSSYCLFFFFGRCVAHRFFSGSITHLSFPSRSHLLSASEDGTLCLFRARDWAVLRSLKGHKGRVNSVAVHPSGKVALSVGKDRALRMWDLMRGKGCASTKLGKGELRQLMLRRSSISASFFHSEGEIVRWSVDGSLFAVQSGSTIDMYSTVC